MLESSLRPPGVILFLLGMWSVRVDYAPRPVVRLEDRHRGSRPGNVPFCFRRGILAGKSVSWNVPAGFEKMRLFRIHDRKIRGWKGQKNHSKRIIQNKTFRFACMKAATQPHSESRATFAGDGGPYGSAERRGGCCPEFLQECRGDGSEWRKGERKGAAPCEAAPMRSVVTALRDATPFRQGVCRSDNGRRRLWQPCRTGSVPCPGTDGTGPSSALRT